MKVKIVSFQPASCFGEEEYENVEISLSYVDEAVEADAWLVCFPEGYPGHNSGMLSAERLKESPTENMQEKAWGREAHIISSSFNPNSDMLNAVRLIGRRRYNMAPYNWAHPNHPMVNACLFRGRYRVAPRDKLTIVPRRGFGARRDGCKKIKWIPSPFLEHFSGNQVMFSFRKLRARM